MYRMEKVIGFHTFYYTYQSISGAKIQFFALQNSSDSTEKRYLWVPVLVQIIRLQRKFVTTFLNFEGESNHHQAMNKK